jgi:hypothetical protein
MTESIQEELRTTGSARVIVIPNDDDAKSLATKVSSVFTLPRSSPQQALARFARFSTKTRPKPKPMQVFPNLGVMLGTVDREGLRKLQKAVKGSARVVQAPVLSLIKPVESARADLSAVEDIPWESGGWVCRLYGRKGSPVRA